MMISELPEDLLEEILCHVPATSLEWLPSTCKRWNLLSNDERFKRKLFDRAAKKFMVLMLKEFGFYSMRINFHRFSLEEVIGGLISLSELHSSLDQTKIRRVSYCDGLFLCVTNTGLVLWNSCTGQTRWILNRHEQYTTYALGSYQDKDSNDNISYKILSRNGSFCHDEEFRIYEINSNSWRILDVTNDFSILGYFDCGVSLKGKTYWIASDEKEGREVDELLLVSFDYTTERFERICLPHHQYPSYWNVSLSVVREEKLLLQRDVTSKTEIWVTNKIGDETKVLSWSMVLALDVGDGLDIWHEGNFWIDEEKKVIVCCDNLLYKGKYKKIQVVGEDNKVRTEDLEVGSSTFLPVLLNYVPSLIHI